MDVRFVINLWQLAGVSLAGFALLNLPILALFLAHRAVQIRDRRFELRVSTPLHTALAYFCGLIYGLVYPGFYFLSVRTRDRVAGWELGAGTNSEWTIAIGAICMAWLAAHMIEAATRGGRPRFALGLLDRVFGLLAVGLGLWFHIRLSPLFIDGSLTKDGPGPLGNGVFEWIYLQSFVLGATVVYGAACWEAFTSSDAKRSKLGWTFAATAGAGAIMLLFAPFWLSLPRVGRAEALDLIRTNREAILFTAEEAGLDPALLAGIIYVAHTRDQPRFTGEAIDGFGIDLWNQSPVWEAPIWSKSETPLDASAGLCQIKPVTAARTLSLVEYHRGWAEGEAVKSKIVSSNRVETILPWRSFVSRLRRQTSFGGNLDGMEPKVSDRLLRSALGAAQAFEPMRELLLEEESNLAVAALMLALLRDQWAHMGFPISDRPEILATLYNLGYDRSHPHRAPRPNDFGVRVARFMESNECREVLGDSAFDRSPDPGEGR